MSKIEDAIRKASLHHEVARRQSFDGGSEADATDPASLSLNRRAPVLFRLQPGLKFEPAVEDLERNRIIHDGFPEAALTGYKMLRTRIQQSLAGNDWKTLAITAAHDGAGKTVTAINLAITLASHGGHEIYLVDLDLRNPSIAEYLGLPQEIPGLRSYLDSARPIRDLLWDVGVQNLAVLANRDRMDDSSERITSKRMQDMISSFRSASPHPIVIFDLPPVLTADDAVAIAPFVDGVLLVASEGETTRDDFKSALELLRNANIVGVVLNKADAR
ncbi:MAG: CpsD/CapB family tyrosine-protein kinase [Woeseia sp.]